MLSSQGLPELNTAISIVVAARLNWVYIACSVLFQGLSVDRLVSHYRPVLEALTLFDRCGIDSLKKKKVCQCYTVSVGTRACSHNATPEL